MNFRKFQVDARRFSFYTFDIRAQLHSCNIDVYFASGIRENFKVR